MARRIWIGLVIVATCCCQHADAQERGKRRRVEKTAFARQVPQPGETSQQTEIVPPFRPQSQGEASAPAPEGGSPTRSGPFAPEQVRLPALGSPKPAGGTPHPTPQTLKRFAQFVERTVDPENTLDVVQGRSRLLILKQIPTRVQILDEDVSSFAVISKNELSVVGNQVGTTVLNLWFGEGMESDVLSYLVRVLPDPEEKERLERVYAALTEEINRTFPDSVIKLTLVGDKIAVTGKAKDAIDAANILRIVSANAPGGGRGRGGTDAEQIPVTSLNVFAEAGATESDAQFGLEDFLLRDTNRQVINLLRVPGEQQVMLRVTVAEVNRTAARSIGIDFSVVNNAGNTVFSSITGGLIPTNVTGSGSSSQLTGGNLPVSIDNGQVTLAVQALRNLNLAKSLAEPNLTTLNGQPATFRAGGEFPVPAATQSFGGVGQGVAFVPFGVQLRFVPYIVDRDRVRLQVSASISTRDPSLGASVGGSAIAGGTQVSGLSSRTFSTTVELRESQTLAVAGLIQNNFGATSNRVPLMGDLPIVGNLFGRSANSAAEQELVVLITPELVAPLDACNTPEVPGADIFEPGDIEFYLLRRMESRRAEDFRSPVRTDARRLRSYHDCEDLFIIGTRGHSINCCPTNSQAPCQPAILPEPVPFSRIENPPSHAAVPPKSS